MSNYIVVDSNLYKITAKDTKRLERATSTEITGYRGNKMQRFNTEDTNVILSEILDKYKPINKLIGIFII